MLTTALINTGDARTTVAKDVARLDVLDVVVFLASCAACALLFFEGGMIGLIGAAGGFAFGWRRPRAESTRLRTAFRAAFAGLWALMIVGASFATVLFS